MNNKYKVNTIIRRKTNKLRVYNKAKNYKDRRKIEKIK